MQVPSDTMVNSERVRRTVLPHEFYYKPLFHRGRASGVESKYPDELLHLNDVPQRQVSTKAPQNTIKEQEQGGIIESRLMNKPKQQAIKINIEPIHKDGIRLTDFQTNFRESK